jgi:hypothetical protein
MSRPPPHLCENAEVAVVSDPHPKGLRKMLVASRLVGAARTGSRESLRPPMKPPPKHASPFPVPPRACAGPCKSSLPAAGLGTAQAGRFGARPLARRLPSRVHLTRRISSRLVLADECNRPNCQREIAGPHWRCARGCLPGTTHSRPPQSTDTIGRCKAAS